MRVTASGVCQGSRCVSGCQSCISERQVCVIESACINVSGVCQCQSRVSVSAVTSAAGFLLSQPSSRHCWHLEVDSSLFPGLSSWGHPLSLGAGASLLAENQWVAVSCSPGRCGPRSCSRPRHCCPRATGSEPCGQHRQVHAHADGSLASPAGVGQEPGVLRGLRVGGSLCVLRCVRAGPCLLGLWWRSVCFHFACPRAVLPRVSVGSRALFPGLPWEVAEPCPAPVCTVRDARSGSPRRCVLDPVPREVACPVLPPAPPACG